jgi:SAM-dependent methyltransferase
MAPDQTVDLYDNTYGKFGEQALADIRRETYGEDIGQNSWLTAEESDTFHGWLGLGPGARVLEVASGSGGPALFLARKHGCRITGVDVNPEAVKAAIVAARAAGADTAFESADADRPLRFEPASFDAVICVDAINHFRDRLAVLREWTRLLKTGGRVLFTDPVVVTGPVSNEELAARSTIGFFLYVPPGVTEAFIREAGLTLLRREDVTANMELTAGRWLVARQRRRADVAQLEGERRFEGLQAFLAMVHRLARERRLSRYAFVAEKRGV